MNNQIPFGFNPNLQQPMYPGINDMNNQIDMRLQNLEQRVNTLENRIKNIEAKLNMTNNNLDNTYNPYQTSMHMM